MDRKYANIIRYLEFLKNHFEFQIVVRDMVGFMKYIDEDFKIQLIPYILHTNAFCSYIKSDHNLLKKCVSMHSRICNKAKYKKGIFFGACHAGVGEYIVPIFSNEQEVIGFISAGHYKIKNTVANNLLKKTIKSSSLSFDIAQKEYSISASPAMFDSYTIESAIAVISDFFSDLYQELLKNEVIMYDTKASGNIESYKLTKIINCVKKNYHNKIAIKQISEYCNCSSSYISHIFKKNIGINIKTYINLLRVNKSKEYLLNSHEKITEIALKVGFSSPNYFFAVFQKLTKMSPAEFKRKNCSKNIEMRK